MIGLAVELAGELIEFPRHLSQHVGGYVLTQDRLDSYVPIGNAAMDDRTFIEWDKDDVDALNMMKVDVLALGMLTCIRKCFDLIADHKGERWELATVPQDVPEVYDMLCRGESLGVFQVESRAQMNMLPRLKPRKILRPRHRGRDRAARSDPGRHGASLSATAERHREGELSLAVARARIDTDELLQGPAQDARRAAVPGTGDADRDRGGRIYLRRGQRIASRDGDVSQCRHHRQFRRQDDRQHDPARLRSRIREKLLQPDQGFRQLTVFRKAMPRVSRNWSMSRHGSSIIIPMRSAAGC